MTIIDKETWPRRAHYDFFTPMSDPFYTLTFPVDVTPLRAWCRGRSLPFYPAMVFAVTKAMEAVDAFHYKDRDGVIVRHDTLVPSFTDLKPGSELFQIVADRAQQGCYFFLFITGQESNVRIELGVGTTNEDAAIFPGRMIDDFFQPHGKGIKCFGSTGLAFDDDQRCFIGGAHECFLQEILAGIARTDAVGRSIGI